MSSNITEDILMTFVSDLEGEEWADNFLFDPSSSSQVPNQSTTSKLSVLPAELSRGSSNLNSSSIDLNASGDSFDTLWMDDGLIEYDQEYMSETTESKKFIPTVPRKVEPDWTKHFDNDQFTPLISVDDMLAIDDMPLRTPGSSPHVTRSNPPRKGTSSRVMNGGTTATLSSSEAIRLKNKQSKLSQFLKNKSFKKYKKMSLSSRLQKVVDFVRSQRGSSPSDIGGQTGGGNIMGTSTNATNNSKVENTTGRCTNANSASNSPSKTPFVYPTPQETTEKFLQLLLGNNKSGKQTSPVDFLDVIHQQAVFESPSLASFVTQVKKMNVGKNLNAWAPVNNNPDITFPSTHTGIGQIAAASRGFTSALRDVVKTSILEKLTFTTQLRNSNNNNMMASLLFTSKNQTSVSFIWKSEGLKAQGFPEELECIGLIRCSFQPEGIKKISLSFDACKIIRQVSAMKL